MQSPKRKSDLRTSRLSRAYAPNSAASNGGGTPLVLPLIGVVGLPLLESPTPPAPPRSLSLSLGPSTLLPFPPNSLSLKLPLSALLLMLNSPSPLPGGGEVASPDVADPGPDRPPDLASDGVRSFHAATILRTEVNGERGEICCWGRRSEPVGVRLPVFVPVPPVMVPDPVMVPEPVLVNVLVNVLV